MSLLSVEVLIAFQLLFELWDIFTERVAHTIACCTPKCFKEVLLGAWHGLVRWHSAMLLLHTTSAVLFHILFTLSDPLCRTWVLAHDVLPNPTAADLITPWLVAYSLPYSFFFLTLRSHETNTTTT